MIWVAVAYVSCAVFLLSFRRLVCIRLIRRYLANGDFRNAISLMWAWASEEELLAIHQRWGERNFHGILLAQRPQLLRLFYPHVLVLVLATLTYQAIRPGAWHGPGPCPAVPNCSNFLIGCLSRYGFFSAISRAHVRYQHCSGFSGVSFHEGML